MTRTQWLANERQCRELEDVVMDAAQLLHVMIDTFAGQHPEIPEFREALDAVNSLTMGIGKMREARSAGMVI